MFSFTEEEKAENRKIFEEFRDALFESLHLPQFVRWLNEKLTARERRRRNE